MRELLTTMICFSTLSPAKTLWSLLVNEAGQSFGKLRPGKAPVEVRFDVGAGEILERNLGALMPEPQRVLGAHQWVLLQAGFGGAVRPDHQQPRRLTPLCQHQQQLDG